MQNKGFLIGTFVSKKNILTFLERLKNNFNLLYERIFIYGIEGNDNEYLTTFKSFDKSYLTKIDKSTIMHVKNGCLFSINALNRLILSEKDNSETPNKEIPINWEKYKDKLIILTNNQLNIKKLSKIDDKASFLSD